MDFAEQHRLKVEKDDCGDAIIPGKNGHIYEYGPARLGVCIMSDSGNANRWNRTRAAFTAAGMEITQNGDYEGCATFDPENAKQAKAAMLRAKVKTKRQVKPETREAMLANLARARKVRVDFLRLKDWQDGVDIELETRDKPQDGEMGHPSLKGRI